MPARLADSRTDTELSVIVGQRVRMDCNPSRGDPEPRVSWIKDGNPLDEDRSRGDVRVVRAGRVLQIRSARVDHAGLYTCVVENKAGRDQKRYVLQVLGNTADSLAAG